MSSTITSTTTSGSGRVPKIVERLQAAVVARRFYEAHQLYKTIYFRCITRHNFAEASDYLRNGTIFLLENSQWESGSELAKLLIKTYRDSEDLPLTADVVMVFVRIYKLMRPNSRERNDFTVATTSLLKQTVPSPLQVTTDSGTSEAAAASCELPLEEEQQLDLSHQFYKSVGRILWQELNFEEARYHLMRSEDGFTTGCLLVEFHLKRGYPSELDMFIAQAVFQYLCMQKLAIAALAFHTYTRRHPNLEPGPPFITYPLLNFVWFLMLAVKSKSSVSVFTVLVEKYSVSLKRDPDFPNYLERIGQLYFGIAKPQSQSNNMLNSIMNMFSGASSVDDLMNDMNGMDLPIPEEMD